MTDWITDRQPTRADADINGKIVVRYDGAILKPWDAILPEEHWSHTSLYRHTIEPAPEPPTAEPASDPGLSDWITDRQPSAEDADKDGEVLMLRRSDGRGNGATGARDAFVDWRHVGPGVPWKHSDIYEPSATAPEPQPAPEPAPVSPARRFVSIRRTINVLDRPTLDAIDDEGIAWVLHPGATEWERLIALPDREVPAQ